MTSVINIRKKELNKRGIANFQEWSARPNSVYIGRNMTFFVSGTVGSKWRNPFSVKKYGRDKCLEMYEEYIRTSKLMNDLGELKGKELGCWCHPKSCHGDILVKLLGEVA